MSLLPVFRKVHRNIFDYGTLITAKKILVYALKPFGTHMVYRIYGIDLSRLDIPHHNIDNFCFKFIKKNDLDLIRQIEGMEEWLQGLLREKLAQEGLCLLAMDKQKVIGFNLIAFNEVYIALIEIKKSLRKDEAWSEQISVHRDYRKRDLATALRYRIFAELKKRNIKWLYGGTWTDNYGSLKLANKVGFKMLKDVVFIRFLSYRTWKHKQLKDS